MAKIILWGTGQIAEVVYYYLSLESEHEICAFCVDKEFLKDGHTFKNKPVIAFEDIETLYPPSEYKMAIPMGYKHLNKYREQKYLKAKEKGYSFISFLSPYSRCDAESVGENTFIFNFNDIQPYTTIGNNVMIWANTGIGHHAVIEDHCFLASPKISGATIIRHHSFLGTNSTIGDNLEIGAYSIIGAGANVTKNVKEGSILAVKQTPSLPLKSSEIEDILG